ncbi:hypothetical protein MKX01_007559 [Papaver californicum]|nr:hypothetical protein MKX01_007559 [Papaver californicum]
MCAGGVAAIKPEMRKLVFKKVEQLKPGTSGHNLVIKVVTSTTMLQKGRPGTQQQKPRQTSIAECLIGRLKCYSAERKDRHVQWFMTLAVDKWGCVEVTEPVEIVVKKDNNLSLVEYELVNIAE